MGFPFLQMWVGACYGSSQVPHAPKKAPDYSPGNAWTFAPAPTMEIIQQHIHLARELIVVTLLPR